MSKLELTSARRSVGIRGKRTRLTITGTLMVVMVMSMIIPLSGAGAHNGTAVQQSVLSIPSNVLDQNQDTWPTNLTARLVDDGILLNWEAPVEDAASVTGYEILRMRPSKEESDLTALVANTDSTGTTYTDATATEAGVRYLYVVKAVRGSQRSGGTNHGFADVPEYNCAEGGYDPTPVEVEVTAVPIVVQSTADHYFVLYAQQQLTVLVEEVPLWMTDGEEDRATSVVDLPVSVTLGQAGTTQLEERVADLPAERYRVERYLISDPADVDRDCFDDITELADPVGRNPVNPAAAIELSVGALVVPDRETFEELSRRRSGAELYYQPDQYPSSNLIEYTKFVLFNMETDRPGVYFMNTSAGMEHRALMEATGLEWNNTIRGELFFHPELVAPDGSRGVYSYRLVPFNSDYSFDLMNRAFTHLAASLPLVDGNFALHLRNPELPYLQDLLPLYRDSRIDLVFDEDVFAETSFQALNPGEGYGLLRLREPDERPHPRDIVIYDALPNNLPRVAGIISTTPQTPLSHVNLRATQDELPNAFIRDALDDADIQSLIGSYVHFTVTEDGWTLRPASPKQVEAYYASSRPSQDHVPERDLSVTSITPLSELGFEDWDAFGVKAANLAVLRSLDFPYPPATVPDGFAVPFYFYDEFMKANGFYDDIRDMLADPDFQSDFDVQQDELKKLRKKIKKGDTPGWINAALVEMHAAYPEGTSLRYRSSTNNEDLPGFNGAGLYDSKTQHPEETEEDGISKSLKQVYASLWNFRAFAEREFHRVDHLTTAMGVLVHPNYSNELANGVAVSFNPMFRTLEWYYVNTQVGEDLVTNPEALSVPEELLLRPHGENEVLATSNLLPPGKLLLSESQRAQLHGSLAVIHNRFKALYNPEPDEPFAMEIEFKITSDNVLSIKQARPWVFNVAIPPSDNIFATGRPIITGTTQVGETLTSDVSGIADEDGLDNAPLSYQWVSNGGTADTDITDAVALTYTVSEDVVGRSIRVRVSFTDDAGYRETLVSQRTDAVQARPNHLATGLPAISGEPQVGEALSVDVSGIDDADGLTNPTFSYHWVSNHGSTETDIEGATEAAYILVSDDAGKTVKVRVTFTDDAGNEEILTSAATALIGDVVEEVVWESELRAGRVTNFFPEQSGYSIYGNLGEILSPNTFVIDGTNYRVLFLTHASESLWLGTEGELPSDFTLRVGDSTYLGSDSMAPHVSGGVSGYWWSSVAPGWFTDDPAQVSLSVHPDVPLESRLKAPVTGYFRDIPADHDGNEDISFRVYFSEGVATTADALRDHVLAVSDGEVSSVEAIGSEGRIWAVSVTPGAENAVTIGIEAGLDCSETAAICAIDGRQLFNHLEVTVASQPSTVNVPTPDSTNNPATGTPSISGETQVGATLTADASGIADDDGLANATFSYQWIANDGTSDADIQDATGTTYNLADADEGKTIKVSASFTDDAGNEESLTSGATAAVAARPNNHDRPYDLQATAGAGTITLTWRDPDTHSSYGLYQILRHRPELGEAEPLIYVEYVQTAERTFTDSTVEPRVQYVYAVKAVKDPFGYLGPASAPVELRMPPDEGANNPASGVPTVTGTVQVGEALTADTSSIADADGLSNVAYSYQWIGNDGTADADIQGATSSTYTLITADAGKTIKLRVSFTDDEDNEETLTSAATAAVAARPNTPGTGSPSIRGVLEDEQELTADTVSVADADGLTNATISYQWIRVDDGTPSDITGQTASTYTLTANDVGKSIQLQVSFTDDRGTAESLTGAVTNAVVASGATRKLLWLSTITVEDHDNLGMVFGFDSSLNEGSLSPAAFTEGGITCSVTFLGTSFLSATTLAIEMTSLPTTERTAAWRLVLHDTELALAHATTTETNTDPPSYRFEWDATALSINDRDLWDDGDEFTVSLQEAVNLSATGLPTIGGTAQVGETLTVSTSDIADDNGLTNVSFSYQWIAGGSDINGATGSSHALTASQQGQTIQVRVSFTDDDGFSESVTSEATAAVAAASVAANHAATGLPTIGGTVQVGETLTVSTSDIADEDGLDDVTYTYQWIAGGSDINGATGSSHTLTASQQSQTIQVRVSFTDDDGFSESVTSEATTAVAAKPPPLTASFSNVPANHNGSSTFTFDLAFSENIQVSFRTIRDEAFTASGGSIAKAQRKTQGSNQNWTITVQPNGNGAISITLPQTTDCDDTGAICAPDGRMLSTENSITVVGQ